MNKTNENKRFIKSKNKIQKKKERCQEFENVWRKQIKREKDLLKSRNKMQEEKKERCQNYYNVWKKTNENKKKGLLKSKKKIQEEKGTIVEALIWKNKPNKNKRGFIKK